MTARAAAIRALDRIGCLHIATRLQEGAAPTDLLEWSPPAAARRILLVLVAAESGGLDAVQAGR